MKGRNVCAAVTGVVIAIMLLILALALMVFKTEQPITTMDSITVEDMDMSLDVLRLRVNMNVTLKVDLSVKNPTKVGFKYSDSTAHINYRGQLIGEAPVPAGEISPEETKGMNLTLTVMADRLLSNSQVYSDVAADALPLNAFLTISGKVTLLGFINVHVVSSSSCDFSIHLSNKTVVDQECHYKTNFQE